MEPRSIDPVQHLASVPEADLRRETRRLRRLASELLFDRTRSEDVVQEAWLAALRGGPADGWSLRAWLAGTVRRLALNENRSRARTRRREVEAARAEATPSTAESLSRIETLRGLVDAVAELDEPYRATIVLRFLDGLAPREVARRQGVPVETVRTRTRRGLERLRARLAERHGERLGAFLGGLLPLAGKAPWRVALGTPAGSGSIVPWSGGLVMSKAFPVAAASIAAVLLVAVGWNVWIVAQEEAEAAPGALASLVDVGPARPDGEAANAAALEREPAAAGRVAVATEASGEPGDWIVRGRVTFGHGDPFVGAPLRAELVALGDDGEDGALLATGELIADAGGCFAWALPAPEVDALVRVRVDLADHFADAAEAHVRAETPAPQGLRTHAMPIDARIVGRVVGPDGGAVAGASLHKWGADAATDVDGRFALDASTFEHAADVWIRAPGCAERKLGVRALDPGTVDVGDVRLAHELVLGGRVVDTNGMPVEGAHVTAWTPAKASPATTDAAGRFELGSLDPAVEWLQVLARKPGYATAGGKAIEQGKLVVDELELVLSRGATLRGVVTDARGVPLPGAWLSVGWSPHTSAATSDGEGRFEIEDAPPGEQTLWAIHPGKVTARTALDLREGEVLDGLALSLDDGGFLAGTVVDEDGAPIPWAWIYAEGPPPVDLSVEPVSADGDGRFRIEGLPDPPFTLGVLRHGFTRHEVPIAELDQDDLVLRVPRAGRIAGRVVDGVTGEPLQRFRIRLLEPPRVSGATLGWTSTRWSGGVLFAGTDGRWSSDDDHALDRPFAVEATADGYGPALASDVRTELDPDPDALVLRLFRPSRVRGRVVASDAVPVEGAQVTCVDASDAGEPRALPYTDTTDAEGRFALEVPTGELALSILLPDAGLVRDGPFLVTDGAEIDRHVVVGQGQRIVGELLQPDGTPIASSTVALISLGSATGASSGHRSAKQTTDERGAFAFENQVEGFYFVRWMNGDDDPRPSMTRLVELEPGAAEAHVELRMRGAATLTGTLRSTEALPDPVHVTLIPVPLATPRHPSYAERSYQVIARDGRFAFEHLEPGTYSVLAAVHAPGAELMLHGSARIDVPDAGTVTVDIELIVPKPSPASNPAAVRAR